MMRHVKAAMAAKPLDTHKLMMTLITDGRVRTLVRHFHLLDSRGKWLVSQVAKAMVQPPKAAAPPVEKR